MPLGAGKAGRNLKLARNRSAAWNANGLVLRDEGPGQDLDQGGSAPAGVRVRLCSKKARAQIDAVCGK